jgi:tetratricopeptide (TPR) repeat protein
LARHRHEHGSTPDPRRPDPGAVAALRLTRTREAYRDHDLGTALLEAEELLDSEPDNIEALELLGDTELELGHGREAGLVFDQLLELSPDEPLYLAGLAIARFLHTDFLGAAEVAERALSHDDGLAEAHAYLGLSLERLGRFEEADEHLARAAALDPKGWPEPPPIAEIPWTALVRSSLERLPEALRSFYERVPIVFQRYPDLSVLRSVDPPISPLVLALYEGSPAAHEGEEEILPRSVRLFQANVRRFAHDLDRLTEDLSYALASEASDWLGLAPPDEEPDHDQDRAQARDQEQEEEES